MSFTEDPLVEPEGDEEETQDPLAGLDEETRAAVEAAVEARIEEERQAAAAAAEETLQRHKQELNSRAKQRLLDRYGIEWTQDNEFVVRDPTRALQSAAAATPAPAPEPEEIPDPAYSPKEFTAWLAAQTRQAVEAAVSPLKEELQKARQFAAAPLLQNVPAQARQVLEAEGLGHIAEHPEFGASVTQALQAGFPEEQWNNPEAIEMAAFVVASSLRKTAKRPAPRDPVSGQFTSGDVARAGLRQMQPSRSAAPPVTQELVADAEDRAAMDLLGITDVREYAALMGANSDLAYADYRKRRSTR